MNQMNVWGMTDIGLVRKENQDAYVTAQHTASGRTVGVVCDGMGGPAGGRVASQIAVSVYLEELEKLLTADQTPQQLLEASAQAAALANQAIQAEAERREECRNMGTTLVSAISYDGGVVVTNVGGQPGLSHHGGRHHPHHQGPLPGGEHGRPGRHHR